MKRILVILSHQLTDNQRDELEQLGDVVNTLSPEHKAIWSQIPATGDSSAVATHIAPITDMIPLHEIIVCQGEFTAFAEVASWCRMLDKPLYVACSARETVETVEPDGSTKKTAVFRHVQFRSVCLC